MRGKETFGGKATGVCCMAEVTLKVESFCFQAVFKNYDHDKDGFISHGEFESIAGNFPFIDSFCVLDADQWVTSLV